MHSYKPSLFLMFPSLLSSLPPFLPQRHLQILLHLGHPLPQPARPGALPSLPPHLPPVQPQITRHSPWGVPERPRLLL